MPESSILLTDGTGGSRLRTRSGTVGGQVVHEQATYRPGEDTYYLYTEQAMAASKIHFGLSNASGSGVFVQLRKLFCINVIGGTAAIVRFDARKGTAFAGGTSITATINKADSLNPALPAGVTALHTITSITGTTLLFPWLTNNVANPATTPLTIAAFQQATNILMEADTIQEYTLQPGEVFAIQQGATPTTGTFGWLLAFTVTSLT